MAVDDRTEPSSVGTEPPQPEEARTAEDFVAALRRLRLWSGLTYRQLEAKATANGDVLPASTLATALGRFTLPREQLVQALVRACGLADSEVERWTAARRRIAMGDTNPPAPLTTQAAAPQPAVSQAITPEPGAPEPSEATPQPMASADSARRRSRPGPTLLLVGLLLAGLGAGGYLLAPKLVGNGASGPSSSGSTTDSASGSTADSASGGASASPAELPLAADGSRVRIRPSQAAELCLHEGRDRSGEYRYEIAALRPCESATIPQTYLKPAGEGMVHIQWHHPEHGIGCLTVRNEGAGKDLLEPWDDCSETRMHQVFKAEPVGQPDGAPRFRLRTGDTGQCVGLRGDVAAPDAEATREDCTGAADQEFLIDLLPSP